MTMNKREKRGNGYGPQGREIIPKITVDENILIGTEARNEYIRSFDEDEMYGMFPILKDFRNRLGGNLSGGQQQQLAIARALVAEPKILILDEPTEGIQPSIIQDIGKSIKKINEWKGISVLIVEQYLDFALDISDYLYVMEKGEIIYENSKEECDGDEVQRLMTQ